MTCSLVRVESLSNPHTSWSLHCAHCTMLVSFLLLSTASACTIYARISRLLQWLFPAASRAIIFSSPALACTICCFRKTGIWPLKPHGDPWSSRVMNNRTQSVECSGASRSSHTYVEITWDTLAVCMTMLGVKGKLLLSMCSDQMTLKAYTYPNGFSRSLSTFHPDDTGVATYILVPALRPCHIYTLRLVSPFDAPIATIARGFVSRKSPYCHIYIIIL